MITRQLIGVGVATLLLAGCGSQGANQTAKPKAGTNVTSKTTLTPVAKPVADAKLGSLPTADEPPATKGMWFGNIGEMRVQAMVQGTYLSATLGQANLSGSVYPGSIMGYIGGGPGSGPMNINLNFNGGNMSGFIGNHYATAHIFGSGGMGSMQGSVANKRMNLFVSPNSVSGDLAGKRVFISGGGDQRDLAGVTAALLAALALAQ